MWKAAHFCLHEQNRSLGTVKKYTQAVSHFLVWYEHEESVPLQLATFMPIALIGYRNELQHVQHKSINTINLRISALRAWCAWLVDQGDLPLDLAARVKLIGGEAGSKREGLEGSQIKELLRQAQISRDPTRNYAIVQVLLQTGIRLSECSGLTFGDFIFGERSGLLLVRAGKGNKVRSVPLNASTWEALATYTPSRLPSIASPGPCMHLQTTQEISIDGRTIALVVGERDIGINILGSSAHELLGLITLSDNDQPPQ